MKLAMTFQKIELKRAMRILPQYYLGVLCLSALLALVVFCGTLLTKDEDESTEITLALVMNKNTYLSNFGLDVLESSASTSSLCTFETTDEASAMEGLKSGRYSGVIVFPDSFISGVLGGGDNATAKLYVPSFGNTFNNGILRGIAEAAGEMLGSSEAGLSAAKEVAVYYNASNTTVKRVVSDLETMFGEYALSREECFVEDVASGTGESTVVQYYFCSALVLLMMLGGVSCGPLLKGDNRAFEQKLMTHRIGPVRLLRIRYIAVLALFGTLYAGVFAALAVGLTWKPELFYELFRLMEWSELAIWFVSGLPMLLLASALVVVIYSFSANQIGGILLLFVLTVVMGYASGCLAPSAFLPKSVRVLGGYLPTAHMLRGLLSGLLQMPDWRNSAMLLAETLLFLTVAMGIMEWKGRVRE